MLSAILLAIGLNLGSNTSESKMPSGVTVSFADENNQRIMPTRLFAARVEAGESPAVGIAPTGWSGKFLSLIHI